MIGQSLYAIIDLVLRLATLLFLLRFLLQAADADRFNPLSQAVVKGSDPFAQPLRKLLPNKSFYLIINIIYFYLYKYNLFCNNLNYERLSIYDIGVFFEQHKRC